MDLHNNLQRRKSRTLMVEDEWGAWAGTGLNVDDGEKETALTLNATLDLGLNA